MALHKSPACHHAMASSYLVLWPFAMRIGLGVCFASRAILTALTGLE